MVNLTERIIKIERPIRKTEEGARGYGGRRNDDYELLYEGIPASVQARNGGRTNPAGLPTDTIQQTWRVLIRLGVLPDGVIRNKDRITDDLGRIFEVTSDYNHGLGYTLTVDRIEV